MKKTIGLAVMGLLLISIALVGCAPAQKTIITTDNLSVLKGTWQGFTNSEVVTGVSVLTQLVILNDNVPVQGSVTFKNCPSALANLIPADNKTAGDDVTINFSEGKVSNDGTIIARSGQDILELTYFAGEKPKIKGWFRYWAIRGTFNVTKK